MNYAGFWIRTLATFIDVIILMMIITPLLYLIYGDAYLAQLAPTEEMKSSLGFWDTFINYMVPVVFTFSAHDRNTKLNLANAYQIKNEAID